VYRSRRLFLHDRQHRIIDFGGSSTVADQKENLKLLNWLKSLKAT
jgi:hypothetical protein